MDEDSRWHSKDALEQPALIAFHQRWLEWAKAEPVPLRTRFDPMAFPRLLPWLVLAEILTEGPTFDAAMRYVGSEIVHYFDSEYLTGTRLSALDPVFVNRWMDVGMKVITTRAPHFFVGAPYLVDREYLKLEMLALPLSRDGQSVDFIVLAMSRSGA